MYGLEDEYIDSTLNVIPDHQFTEVNDPSYTTASVVTVSAIAERATLWEGDRLSMIYDFGLPHTTTASSRRCTVETRLRIFSRNVSRSLRPRQPRSSTRNDPSNGHERSVVPLFFTRLLKRVINARLSVL